MPVIYLLFTYFSISLFSPLILSLCVTRQPARPTGQQWRCEKPIILKELNLNGKDSCMNHQLQDRTPKFIFGPEGQPYLVGWQHYQLATVHYVGFPPCLFSGIIPIIPSTSTVFKVYRSRDIYWNKDSVHVLKFALQRGRKGRECKFENIALGTFVIINT